jgi:hypothetical protein
MTQGLADFVNKINNLATRSWKTNSGLCSIENKKKSEYKINYEIEAKNNGEGRDENLNIKCIWPKRQECERKSKK